MRILVFLKEILDAESPFVITDEMQNLDGLFMPHIVDPADLHLLDMLRNAFPMGSAELIAVDVTLSGSEEAVRKGIAYGADRAVVVCGEGVPAALSGRARGAVAAALMKSLEADIAAWNLNDEYLMLDGAGAYMAEQLGIPQVSRVCAVDGEKGSSVVLYRKLDHGDREKLACSTPMVLVSDGSRSSLPYPPFPRLLKAQFTEVEHVDVKDLDVSASDLRDSQAEGVYLPPRPRPKRKPEKKKSGAARMASMMGGGAKKKTDNLVEADAATAAARIVEFLEQKNLLS